MAAWRDETGTLQDTSILPSGYVNSLLLKMAIEIVDLPINSMVIFHSFLYVYQRVMRVKTNAMFTTHFPGNGLYMFIYIYTSYKNGDDWGMVRANGIVLHC